MSFSIPYPVVVPTQRVECKLEVVEHTIFRSENETFRTSLQTMDDMVSGI